MENKTIQQCPYFRHKWGLSVKHFAMLFLLVLFSTSSFAYDSWSDSPNYANSFAGGSGTYSDPYKIATAAQLGYLSYVINENIDVYRYNTSSTYYELVSDIDLGAHEFYPIGRHGEFCNFQFNGNNHKIENFWFKRHDWPEVGLFSRTSSSFVLRNLTLKNVNIVAQEAVGAFVGCLSGDVINCHVDGGDIRGWFKVGGIAGLTRNFSDNDIMYSSVNCKVYSRNHAGSIDLGGIVGDVQSTTYVRDCIFSGILGSCVDNTTIGGVVGVVKNSSNLFIRNVVFSGRLAIISSWNTSDGERKMNNYSYGFSCSKEGILIGGKDDSNSSVYVSGFFYNESNNSGAGQSFKYDGCYNGYTGLEYAMNNSYKTETYNKFGYYPSQSKSVLNSPAFAYALNKYGDISPAFSVMSDLLCIDTKYYVSKIGLGNYIESTQSVYSSPYVMNDSLFKINVQDRTSDGYLPYDVSGLSNVKQIGETQFEAKTMSLNPTASALYEKVITPKNLSAEFSTLDKRVNLVWSIDQRENKLKGKLSLWRKEGVEKYVHIKTFDSIYVKSYVDKDVNFNKKYSYQLRYTCGSQDTSYYVDQKHYSNFQQSNEAQIYTTPSLDITLKAEPDTVNTGISLFISFPSHENLNGAEYSLVRKGEDNMEYTYDYDENENVFVKKINDLRGMGDPCTPIVYTLEIVPNNTLAGGIPNPIGGITFVSEKVQSVPTATPLYFKDNYKFTKGEFNNEVKLSWSVNKSAESVVKYKIYRRIAETNSDYVFVNEITSLDMNPFYSDYQVLSGLIYEYKIELYSQCSGDYTYQTEITDLGYSQLRGTVAGQVTFGSGTAVDNVSIFARNNSITNDKSQYYSIYVDDLSENKWYMGKTTEETIFESSNFAVQMYVRPETENSDTKGIFNIFKTVRLSTVADGNAYKLKLDYFDNETEKSAVSEFTIPAEKFTHISLVRDEKKLTVYVVNDQNLDSVYLQSFSANIESDILGNLPEPSDIIQDVKTNLPNAGYYLQLGSGFKGFIDEVRIWTKSLSINEIISNYDRLLSGNESNLKAYWQFDEGLSSRFFDISNNNGLFNSNHGYLKGSLAKTIVPNEETQLGLKGVTDINGNYIINGIPYSGSGSSYSIVPMKGVHEFQPAEHLRFISQSSLIHNGTDFNDISSFEVSGKVTYANSNFPVEGANLMIDGVFATRNNQAVTTDVEGKYTIDVPIGEHYISVQMQKHEFENEGRFPVDNENLDLKYNFVNPKSGINFIDNTTIRIAGRIAGGNIEAQKQLGYGLSEANIGQATIELEAMGINYFTSDLLIVSPDTAINSVINIQSGAENGRKIIIKTDPETGEYLALLPPLQYQVSKIYTASVSSDKFGFVSEIITPDINILTEDSLANEDSTEYRYFSYHSRFDKIYKSQPQFFVSDNKYVSEAFGDSIYVIKKRPLNDTIVLFSNTPADYLLGHPVFTTNNPYKFKLKAYETYINTDGIDPISVNVPCSAAVVTVTNQIGNTSAAIDTTDYQTVIINPTTTKVTLDENGEALYSFNGGLPYTVAPYTLNLSMNLNHDGAMVDWKLNGDGKGIVFGSLPKSGNNYITTGPNFIDFVLHDPPGSASYSYIEKGSTLSTSYTIGTSLGLNNGIDSEISLGYEMETATGSAGFGALLSTTLNISTEATLANSLSVSTSIENSNTFTSNISFTENIQTNATPDFVGANADIFIGKSSNMLVGEVFKLGLFDKNSVDDGINYGDYSLTSKEDISVGVEFGTQFIYTQDHIINNLIPEIKRTRKGILIYVSDYADSSLYSSAIESYYLTTIPLSDPIWESSNVLVEGEHYIWIEPTSTKIAFDMVSSLTGSIQNWENVLAENEKVKIDNFGDETTIEIPFRDMTLSGPSFTAGYLGNISIDAGARIEKSLVRFGTRDNSVNSSVGLEQTSTLTTGFSINKLGTSVTISSSKNISVNTGYGNSAENAVTYGYALEDGDAANYSSVDIHLPLNEQKSYIVENHSHIFRVRGGQSSCPYEGPTETQYYEAGTTLDLGTQQIDEPVLLVTSEQNLTNISSGREASYILSIGNANPDLDRSYVLSFDDSSNPNGLDLRIDGASLAVPRTFSVPANSSIQKTLKIKQTNIGVLDYENVKLLLDPECGGSTSDITISSEQYISAHFVPSCSEISLSSDDLILNTSTSKTSTDTVNLNIYDFDRTFYGFAAVRLQYKTSNALQWTTIKEYVVNEDLIPLSFDNEKLPNVAVVTYPFSMTNVSYPDGNYIFRAVAVGKPGGANAAEVYVYSNEINVLKDKKRPQLFGNASPVNGILTPETELSVVFNEDILSSYIIDDFFSVKSVMNGVAVDPKTGLQFAGGSPVYTETDIPLANKNFTFETWFKRTPGQSGTIIAHGDNFSVGFNANDKVVVKINGNTYESVSANTDINWQYISVSYNEESHKLNVHSLYGETNETVITDAIVDESYSTNGHLFIGAKADGSDAFTGYVNETSLWGYARGLYDLGDRNTTKIGNETGLLGYWQMDEAYGIIAKDKARSRNLTLPNENYWLVDAQNVAVNFDGTQYLELESKIVNSDENYAMEFWFKGAPQSNATMFSCGHGTLDSITANQLSIGVNTEQKLTLNANGSSFVLSENNYMDNSWHHITLNVVRNGSTSIYVDETLVKQISSNNIGGLLNATFTLGAAKYRTVDNMLAQSLDEAYTVNNFFNGSIDEFRLWKATTTAKSLLQTMRTRIAGDEKGLVAYYPFEKYNDYGDAVGSLSDKVNQPKYTGITPANDAVGTYTFTQESPALKEVRPIENVNFTWTASNNKIVFNITEPLKRIEGTTLELSVENISDLNGNYLDGTVNWTAFVDMNRLKWSDDEINIEIEEGESYSFEVLVSNQSGREEDWALSNMPSWLNASITQGTLQPLSTQKVVFSVAEGVNIGNYEQILLLSGYNQIDENLSVNLKVNGEKPDWNVDPNNFENSMNIIGKIQIEDVYQTDTHDIIAAFDGETCVGIASPQYFSAQDAYFTFMTVYSNSEQNNISFKLWDASNGRIYTVVETSVGNITFNSSSIIGSVVSPVLFNALDVVSQGILLTNGWNWISTNIEMNNNDGFAQFVNGVSNVGLVIKAPKEQLSSNYSALQNSWFGSLNTINNDQMYMVKTNNAHTLYFNGEMANVNDHAINIVKGWNYIGYVPQSNMSVSNALADIDAKNGDVVKAQTQFATYAEGIGWIGNLNYMQAGKGYMYLSQNDDNFNFNYPVNYAKGVMNFDEVASSNHWTVNSAKYPTNMTSTLVVNIDYIEQFNDSLEIGAFVGDECRGSARLINESQLGRYVAYLMVFGETNENVTLRLFDHATNTERSFEGNPQMNFAVDATYGNPDEPFVANFFTVLNGINEIGELNCSIFPNPTNGIVKVSSANVVLDKVEIADISGRIISIVDSDNYNVEIDLSNLSDGVYFLKIYDVNNNLKISKITKE